MQSACSASTPSATSAGLGGPIRKGSGSETCCQSPAERYANFWQRRAHVAAARRSGFPYAQAMAVGRWAPDNAIRNFAAALVLSPYGTADLAGAQGDPQDPEWRAASACARHCQKLAYLSAGLWQHVSLPDLLRTGPPSPADISEGA